MNRKKLCMAMLIGALPGRLWEASSHCCRQCCTPCNPGAPCNPSTT